MLQEIREIMGLTISQVADELSQSIEWVTYSEAHDTPRYARLFFDAFPVNPNILKNPDDDPFIPQYEQSSIGERLESWMKENEVSVEELAGMLSSKPEHISALLKNPKARVNRRRGEVIEKACGINRKWLMYGDGRIKGKPVRDKNKDKVKHIAASADEGKKAEAGQTGSPAAKAADRAEGTRLTPRQAAAAKAKELGKEIRAIRKSMGLTINEAADKLHIRRSVFSSIESGATTMVRTEETLRGIKELRDEMEKERAKEEAKRGQTFRAKEKSKTETELSPVEKEKAGKKAPRGKAEEAGESLEDGAEKNAARKSSTKGSKSEPAVTGLEGLSKKELGNRIRQARKKAGLSLKEAGDICGITAPTLSQVECGRVSTKRAAAILDMLAQGSKHVQLDMMLDEEVWPRKAVVAEQMEPYEQDVKAKADDSLKTESDEESENEADKASEKFTDETMRNEAGEALKEDAEDDSDRKGTGVSEKRSDNAENLSPGERLALARKQAGLSQLEVANLAGINQSGISRMERGNPKPEAVERIIRLIQEKS